MAETPFLLLPVASDDSDRRLAEELLDPGSCELHWVGGAAAAVAALVERSHDVVLLHASLASTVHQLLEEDPRAQVIVLGDASG